MRINLRPIMSLTALASLALASSPAMAKWISPTGEPVSGVSMSLVKSDSVSTIVRFHINGVEVNDRSIDGRTYTDVTIPGTYNTDVVGQPSLPTFSQSLMIPASANATLRVLDMRTAEEALGEPTPSKGSITRDVAMSSVPYTFGDIYETAGRFPTTEVSLSRAYTVRDIHGVTVALNPVIYDSATKLSTIVTDVTVEIRHNQVERAFRMTNAVSGMDRDFARLYQDHFPNFRHMMLQGNSMRAGQIVAENSKMLVITHADFVDAMKPFVDWKTQKGFTVKMVTLAETGPAYTDIKAYIQKVYDADKIAYVILVGDAEQVPFHPGKSGNAYRNEADPMYALTAGTDSYPDLFISRFSVKNPTMLATQINKSIAYERNPDVAGDWYGKGTGIASNEGNPTDGQRAEILREKLLKFGYTEIDKLYDPGVTSAKVAEVLNLGRGFVNYIGHGSKTSWGTSGFSNTAIDALNNGNKLPFIVSVACVNGDFSGTGEAFAERWMNAGSPEAPKGAIAIFASSTNQAWVEPTIGQGSIVDLLIAGQARSVGGLSFNGELAMIDSNMSGALQTFETWHLFGDASLELRTKMPTPINSTIESYYSYENRLTLNVGEEGLRAGLVQDGILMGSGVSNAEGKLEINIARAARPGAALLTITGFDKIPVQMDVQL